LIDWLINYGVLKIDGLLFWFTVSNAEYEFLSGLEKPRFLGDF